MTLCSLKTRCPTITELRAYEYDSSQNHDMAQNENSRYIFFQKLHSIKEFITISVESTYIHNVNGGISLFLFKDIEHRLIFSITSRLADLFSSFFFLSKIKRKKNLCLHYFDSCKIQQKGKRERSEIFNFKRSQIQRRITSPFFSHKIYGLQRLMTPSRDF